MRDTSGYLARTKSGVRCVVLSRVTFDVFAPRDIFRPDASMLSPRVPARLSALCPVVRTENKIDDDACLLRATFHGSAQAASRCFNTKVRRATFDIFVDHHPASVFGLHELVRIPTKFTLDVCVFGGLVAFQQTTVHSVMYSAAWLCNFWTVAFSMHGRCLSRR